jgi:hypothetical protein
MLVLFVVLSSAFGFFTLTQPLNNPFFFSKMDGGEILNNAKFKSPCRYYKFGTCKMGDQCRFVHLKVCFLLSFILFYFNLKFQFI